MFTGTDIIVITSTTANSFHPADPGNGMQNKPPAPPALQNPGLESHMADKQLASICRKPKFVQKDIVCEGTLTNEISLER